MQDAIRVWVISYMPSPGFFVDPILPVALRPAAARYVMCMAVKVIVRELYGDDL
jgi:hypothetical protein